MQPDFSQSEMGNASVCDHAERSEGPTSSEDRAVNDMTSLRRETAEASPPLPLLASVRTGILEEGRFVIGPEMARQILDRFNYKNQRNVEKRHVSKLAVEMKNGVWTPGSQIAFGVMPDQMVHLVNGQHRLHAVIEAGVAIEFQLLLVPVADEYQLHQAYYRFDTVQRGRSDAMVMRSTGLASKHNLPRDVASAAFRAGVVIASDLRILHATELPPEYGTPDGKLAAIDDWWPQVKAYNDLISEAPGRLMARFLNKSIMAVALVTLKDQPFRAAEFWGGVARDDGLTKGDPRKAMLAVLRDYDFKQTNDAALIYAAHCWDAWFEGRSVRYVKYTAGSTCRPLGTRFDPKWKRS